MDYVVAVATNGPKPETGAALPPGLGHALAAGQEHTLCGLAVDGLAVFDDVDWAGGDFERCADCTRHLSVGG